MGGFAEEATLHHGIASWDLAGTYTFIVPRGVTRLLIDLQGGWALGTGDSASRYLPMGGARCLHWVDVTPGVSLTIVVGAAGTEANSGGDSTCTGAGIALTAGGGTPGLYSAGAGITSGSMRPTSGGNVLAQGSGVGYCVIQW
jgi:hypothetical protein